MKPRLHPAPLLVLILSLCAAAPAFGARTLYWRALDVTARLDAEGALHLVERHAMVFTGDWNGGERVFRVAPGQHLRLESVRRIDPFTGAPVEMVGGDVDLVDHYTFTGGNTLRWRSRMPSNPPFSNTHLVYEIAYTLDRVLLKSGDVYTLDQNFALPDADETIEALSVNLDLDPAWTPPANFALRRTAGPLAPGSNYTVRVDLRYGGAAAPAVLRTTASPSMRLLLFGVLLIATGAIVVSFVRRESRLGRFAPPPAVEAVDGPWLQQHVLDLPPEHVGALWDEAVGGAEVAALLARLTAEKKVKSWSEHGELSLRLLQPIDSFTGYEAALLRALFFDGRSETSTKAVKDHYEATGFNPADTIKDGLREAVAAHAEAQQAAPKVSSAPTLILYASGLALALLVVLRGDAEMGTVLWAFLPAVVLWLIGITAASMYQSRVERPGPWALSFAFVPVFFLVGAAFATGSRDASPPLLLIGLLFVKIGIVTNIFNLAKTRDSAAKLARRRQLATARRYFAQELQQPQPRLEDAWFPWLVAFGLAGDVDRWFLAHAPATRDDSRPATVDRSYSPVSSSSTSTSWTGGGFTGGGGMSGGAGASGTWAAAAEGMAAGVSAPQSSGSSDSGSSSSSSSSGSSGGGGGGGW